MRHSLAYAAFLICISSGPASAGPDERVEERPWAGVLPDLRQGFGGSRPVGTGEWFAVLLRDAETGAPVPGARLVRTPESEAGGRLHHDMVLAVGIADADGIARVPVESSVWKEDCNWLALADGHAPAHDYGAEPDPEMLLPRGDPFRGRVLDPMGRPVAGAVVENLGGCSHGTAAQRSVAGADGIVAFAHSEPTFGQLWIEGPGIASDLMAFREPDSLGRAPASLAMETGYRFKGRVVDLLGEPLAGVVVRHYNEQRGPVTMSGRDGTFVLGGVNDRDPRLVFYPPLDLTDNESTFGVDDGAPDVPMTVVLTPLRVHGEEKTARVRVRCRLPSGVPASGVGYRVLSTVSGRGPWGVTADKPPATADDVPIGEGVEEVAPGAFRVVPDEPFGAFEFDPAEVDAKTSEAALVELVVRSRPVLRIRGVLPQTARLTLALTDDSLDAPGKGTDWTPSLPADQPAILRVRVPDRPPFFFPVGPEKDGVRNVEVILPEPRRIHLPAGTEDADLFDGTRKAAGFRDGGDLLSDAVGHLTLRLTDASGRTSVVAVDLPATPGAEVGVDPAAATELRKEIEIRVLHPAEDGKDALYETVTRYPGQELVVKRDGWRTLRWTPADGDLLRWGDAAVELSVSGEAGEACDAVALVDGELYEVEDGRLALRGFRPGPHRAIIALRDRPGAGRELRFSLRAGETLKRPVVLAAE
jgi:hypothetical protein